MSLLRPLSVALFAIVVAACSGASATERPSPSAPPSGPPAPSAAPSDVPSPSAAPAMLLLKVTTEGGFINPAANLAALPTVAVYSDGRILTPGAVPAIYPGPLVSPVAVHDVGAAGAAAILAEMRKIGLDKPATAGPGIPGDSGTSIFTAVVDGATTTSRFSGNGRPGQPGGPVAPGDEERVAAMAMLDRLLDPTDGWGGPAGAESLYAPIGYRIFVAPGAPANEQNLTQSPVAWPLATPLAEFGTPAVPDRGIAGLRQGAVMGDDAAAVGALFQKANTLTAFTSGGASYTLYVRPLYPDEVGG
jgi:hypothetical protein